MTILKSTLNGQILLSGFREGENASTNQLDSSASFWLISPKNKDLVEEFEYMYLLYIYKVSSNCIQRLKRSPTFLSQSDAQAAIFVSNRPQNKKLVEDIELLLSAKFREIPFSGCNGEGEHDSTSQRQSRHLLLSLLCVWPAGAAMIEWISSWLAEQEV